MKAKIIKAVIRKKVDQWLESIDVESVRELAKENTIVTGGCIASMLLNEKVNDFDLYFRNKETAEAIARYYLRKFKASKHANGESYPSMGIETEGDRVKIVIVSSGIATEKGKITALQTDGEENETDQMDDHIKELVTEKEKDEPKQKYRPVYITANAITLSDKVQLIIRFYGEPDEIHRNYDFVHCTNYWQSWDGYLELNKAALESLITKELRYIGSLYPLCSIIRSRKFIKRGFTINAGQYLKMAMQLNGMDLHIPEVLEEQLIGVDVAYFGQVIEQVKEKDPEKIDSTYLMTIIDKIF